MFSYHRMCSLIQVLREKAQTVQTLESRLTRTEERLAVTEAEVSISICQYTFVHTQYDRGASCCVLLLQNVFSYYRMCSLIHKIRQRSVLL